MKLRYRLCMSGMLGMSFMLHAGTDCHASSETEAYARISGIVRYYSPNPYTEKWDNSDWLYIDYCNFSALCGGMTLEEVLDGYLSVFVPNGSLTRTPSPGTREIDADEYFHWLHHGCGEVNIPKVARVLSKEYRDYRPFFKELVHCAENGSGEVSAYPQADSLYCYRVAEDLYLNMPLAESKEAFSEKETASVLKEAGKQWNASLKQHGSSPRDRILGLIGDRAFRLADMAFRWNVIQHFYPYHQEDSLDWESYLPEMMQAVDTLKNGKRTRSDIKTYYDAVLRAMNPVKDGHLQVYPSLNLGGMLSFYINYGHAPVIFRMNPATGSIFIADDGDAEVLRVNGVEASLLYEDCRHRVNMSNDVYASELALKKMTQTADMGDRFVIETRAGNLISTDTLYGTLKHPLSPEIIPDYSMKVIDSILVFNPTMSRECYDRFLPCLDSIMAGRYRALVFDLRDYPAYDFDKVLAHLTDTALSTEPLFHVPLSCFPNREHIRWSEPSELIEPALPNISIPVFFLSGSNTISWGETILQLVKGYGLGTVIGAPTAGTNGDATSVPLPMFEFRMTAVKATNVDGSRHHGVGVIPDIYTDSDSFEDFMEIIEGEL